MTLVEFLTARLDEDEAVARRADADRVHVDPDLSVDAWVCHDTGTHVGLSPARVLAEVAAKRRIVEMFSGNLHEKWDDGFEAEKMVVPILRTLALPYASHEDYDAGWAL